MSVYYAQLGRISRMNNEPERENLIGKMHSAAIKRGCNNAAVSEVIGSILLVTIVVTAASIVGVVLLSQPPPQTIPAFDAVISKDTGNNWIHLYHDGGNSLNRVDIKILVDGNDSTNHFNNTGVQGWPTWAAGESLDYNYTGSDPKAVQIIYTGAGSSSVLVAAYF